MIPGGLEHSFGNSEPFPRGCPPLCQGENIGITMKGSDLVKEGNQR